MPSRALPNFKPKRRPTYIKAWRKHRGGMSQAKFIEKMQELTGYEISEGQLSRIERGEQPYNQDFLEAAAVVLMCGTSDLLNVDPTIKDVRYSILEGLSDRQLKRLARLAQAVREEDEEDEELKRGAG